MRSWKTDMPLFDNVDTFPRIFAVTYDQHKLELVRCCTGMPADNDRALGSSEHVWEHRASIPMNHNKRHNSFHL